MAGRTILREGSILLLSLGLGGCGGSLNQGMEPGWTYDKGRSAKAFLAELDRPEGSGSSKSAVAVGVSKEGLIGRSLPDGTLWKRKASPNVLPSLSGAVVAYSEEESVTALVAGTGQVLWSIPSSGRLLEGMSDSGEVTALLLVDRHDARPDIVVVLDRTGHERFRRSTNELMGTPVVSHGMLLVPWGRQYVSAYDQTTGNPLGRLLLRDSIGGLLSTRDGVFALGRGSTKLGAKLAEHPDWESIKVPKLQLPGEPRWPTDGASPRKLERESVSLLATPDETGKGFVGGTIVSVYYSILVGLAQSTGSLKWVNWLPKAAIAGAVGDHGAAICSEDGSVTGVSLKDGQLMPLGSLETRLSACVVTPPAEKIQGIRPIALEEQVRTVIETAHSDMEAEKGYLLSAVKNSPRPEVTKMLLSIAKDPLRSGEIRAEAARALEARRDSPELFLAELESALRRAKGEDVPAAPLPVLAKASERLKLREAAPLLVEFLKLPLVSDEDAVPTMNALGTLGGPAEVEGALVFVRNFRTTGGSSELVAALSSAVHFILENGSEETARTLGEELEEASTHPLLKEALGRAKSKAPPKKPKATTSKPVSP